MAYICNCKCVKCGTMVSSNDGNGHILCRDCVKSLGETKTELLEFMVEKNGRMFFKEIR